MSQSILGLDIGHYSIKAIKLSLKYRQFNAEIFDEELLNDAMPEPESVQRALSPEPPTEPSEEGQPLDTPITLEDLNDALHTAQDEAFFSAIYELHNRGSLDAELIAVSLPPDLILPGHVQFPFSERRQLETTIPVQFSDTSPIENLSEYLLDHHVIGRDPSSGQFDIEVGAARLEDLSIQLERLQDAGVDPSYILSPSGAMLHLAQHLLPDVSEPFALLDLGHKYTHVAFIEPQPDDAPHILGAHRSVQFGGHNLTQALERALSLPYKDAETFKHTQAVLITDPEHNLSETQITASNALQKPLARLIRHLRASIQAHSSKRRAPIQRIYIYGGTSRLSNLRAFLQESLDLPIDTLSFASEPIVGLQRISSSSQANHAIGHALSLALREPLPSTHIHHVNFRRGPFAPKRSRSFLSDHALSLSILTILLVGSLLIFFFTRLYALDKQHEAVTESLGLHSEQLLGEKITNPAQINKALKSTNSGPSILPSKSAYDFFYEVNTRLAKGPNVELFSTDVDLTRNLIKLEAQTGSAADVDQIVESLEGFKCFKGNVNKGNVESVGEDKVKFSLNIAPQCSPVAKDKKKGK